MEQQRRQPRPYGLTIKSLLYQRTLAESEDRENSKEALQANLIKSWLANNLTIQGIYYNQSQLQDIYGIDKELIRKCSEEVLSNTITDTDDLSAHIRASLKALTAQTQEDRGRVAQHLMKLELSEGGQYKPFISAEVTKALKLMTETTTNNMKLLQLLMPSNTTQNLIQIFQGTEGKEDANVLTTERALQLLNGTAKELPSGAAPSVTKGITDGTLEPSSDRAQEIYNGNQIDAQPEVGARAIDTENQPTASAQKAVLPEEQEGPKKVAEHREKHDNRRAEELGL